MLLVGWQEGHVACKKNLMMEQGADLHTAQLMPLPSMCLASVKSRLVLYFWYWLTWIVPEKAIKCVRVCVRARMRARAHACMIV